MGFSVAVSAEKNGQTSSENARRRKIPELIRGTRASVLCVEVNPTQHREGMAQSDPEPGPIIEHRAQLLLCRLMINTKGNNAGAWRDSSNDSVIWQVLVDGLR